MLMVLNLVRFHLEHLVLWAATQEGARCVQVRGGGARPGAPGMGLYIRLALLACKYVVLPWNGGAVAGKPAVREDLGGTIKGKDLIELRVRNVGSVGIEGVHIEKDRLALPLL